MCDADSGGRSASPHRPRMTLMAPLAFSHRSSSLLLALALSGCAGSFTLQTSSTGLGGSNPADNTGSTEAAGAESPQDLETREKARAWFGKCSATYDDFMTTWRPHDAEAKKIIAEQRGKPFYEAYSQLAGEYRKLRQETKKTEGGDNLPSMYGYGRGTALELLLAIADMQIRTGYVGEFAFDPNRPVFLSSFPMTGDDAFDRTTFCSYATYTGVKAFGGGPGKLEAFDTDNQNFPAPWMTRKEKAEFRARVDELLEKTRLALNAIIDKHNAWNEIHGRSYGGDYGVVKQVKVQADGSTLAQCKAVDTPYTCAHTGNYRWNGVAFNDCDVVDLPSRETYAFSVVFKELPSAGLKPGDKITFGGDNPKGRTADDKVNAAWQGGMLTTVWRRGKQVVEANLLDKLDNPR